MQLPKWCCTSEIIVGGHIFGTTRQVYRFKRIQNKKKIPFNVGIIIFGIIFFYLIVTIILYLTSPHITSYEVREGSILNDYEYTGLAIREE